MKEWEHSLPDNQHSWSISCYEDYIKEGTAVGGGINAMLIASRYEEIWVPEVDKNSL